MQAMAFGMPILALVCCAAGAAMGGDVAMNHGSLSIGAPSPLRADGSLTTLFGANGGYAGNSFDITASTAITIVGWDCNLDEGAWDVEVWTRNGTADGYEQIAGDWTLLGAVPVTGAGLDLPTYVDIGGLDIDTGQLVGVIVRVQAGSGINYTNGGPDTYANDDLSITTYRGLSDGWPPGAVFLYRIWNGTVYYDHLAVPVDETTWGTIKGALRR